MLCILYATSGVSFFVGFFLYRDSHVTVVSLKAIVDKCILMDLTAQTGYMYASLFQNCKDMID